MAKIKGVDMDVIAMAEAKAIYENLTHAEVSYARSEERGKYRGFSALHDLMDANCLIEGFADDLDMANRIVNLVDRMIKGGIDGGQEVRSISRTA